MSITFTEIAFTAYPVSDMKRSRAFYEGILGLKPGMVNESPSMAWVEYEIGATVLSIGYTSEGNWKPSPLGASAALEVTNFEEAIEHLRANNVRFEMEPMETPVCHMAVIKDPDDSKILIHKRKNS